MSLENPNFIDDFNEAWPAGAVDQLHEGDDHIRNLKKAIQNTFPGMVGRAWRSISRATNFSPSANDNMTLNNCAAITVTPDAASVLGNGWMCLIRASGGDVVINPAQNINGQGQVTVPSGYTSILFSNGSEFFSMIVYQDVPPSVKAFPTGTRMVFQQTTAPTGWTKDASAAYNDATFRSTNGTVGTGGADAFTSHFGSGKSTNGHAITEAQTGPHSHSLAGGSPVLSGGGVNVGIAGTGGSNMQVFGSSGTTSAGGGAVHSHGLSNFNIKYVDLIVASIN